MNTQGIQHYLSTPIYVNEEIKIDTGMNITEDNTFKVKKIYELNKQKFKENITQKYVSFSEETKAGTSRLGLKQMK